MKRSISPAFQPAALSCIAATISAWRGGLGRAGTIAASLLIELGDEAGIALQRVRKARPGAVETSVQERYLRTYQRWVNT